MSEGESPRVADATADAEEDGEQPPQVYPLIADRANRTMLVEWLGDVEEYSAVDPDVPFEEASFDLCIVDEGGFQRHQGHLRDRKEGVKPVLLPVLLLLPEADSELLGADHGELADTVVTSTIDEILSLPVRQAELRWRIESLLRLREETKKLVARESQLRQFKQAVDAAGHAIYITETDGTITYVNPAFEEITGHDEAEAVGADPGLLTSGEMPDSYYENLWDTLESGGVWDEEIINEKKSGELYQAQQTIAPVTDESGEVAWYVAIQTDITDRKQLETLRRQYQQAIESSVESLAAVDNDGNYLFANETYREYHGIDADETVHGRALEDVLSAETVDTIEPHLETVRGEDTAHFEMRREHPTKGERALDVMYYPLEGEEGDQQGVIASIRDNTEEKERLRRLETLVSNLPGLVYRCKDQPGWPTEFVAGKCEEITGYPAEKLEADEVKWGAQIVHPDDREQMLAQIRDAVDAGEPYELSYRIRTADDEVRWVREQGRAVTPLTSEETMLEGFIMDVTERKERERELRQKTRAIDTAPIGIYITDPTGEGNPIVYANEGFTELTGYDREDTVGREFGFLQGEHTDPQVAARIETGISDAERVSVKIRNYRADGTEFWSALELAPVRDGNGEVINWIGFIQDVTDRVERQRQIQLIDRVLRHNLRNDLNVVKGMAEFIRTDADGEIAEYADRILDTSSSLLETVEKERNITQILEDEPVLEPIELMASIESSAEVLEAQHPEATIDVSGPEEVRVRATKQIHQAIEEVITNSVEHHDGGAPQVTVEVTRTNDDVTVEVSDDGPGIPEMELGVLSGEEEATPLYHGIGLGLWLVYLIARRSVGTVEFADNEPEGSVVTLRLNAAEDPR